METNNMTGSGRFFIIFKDLVIHRALTAFFLNLYLTACTGKVKVNLTSLSSMVEVTVRQLGI